MSENDLNLMIDFYKSKYQFYFERYDFEKQQNKALTDTNDSLYKRLQKLDEQIGDLMKTIDEKNNEIINYKRFINEAHLKYEVEVYNDR